MVKIRNNVLDAVNPERIEKLKKLGWIVNEDDIWEFIGELESYIKLGTKYGRGIKFLAGKKVYNKILKNVRFDAIPKFTDSTVLVLGNEIQLNKNIDSNYIIAYAKDCDYDEETLVFDTAIYMRAI